MEIIFIVGYKDMAFTGQDGNEVRGRKYFYVCDENGVTGQASGSFFLTESALSHVGYVPNVEDQVEVYYNRYGKVSQLRACR